VTVGGSLIAFSFYRLYERDRGQLVVSSLDEWHDFLDALSLIALLELLVGHGVALTSIVPVRVGTVALFWGLALLLLPLARASMRHFVFPTLTYPQNTVILGAGYVGQMVALKVIKHREYNVNLVGFLDDAPHLINPELAHIPVVGGEGDLVDVIREHKVARVILAFSRRPADQLLDLLRNAGLQDVHLSIVPRYFEIIASSAGISDVDGVPVVEIPASRLSRAARATKRAFDLTLATIGIVVLAPVFATTAVAIKLDSHGPIFFRQRRMGRNEKAFDIIKFRTMVDGAESLRDDLLTANESTGPLFKIRTDPRVTRVGWLLRRLSLDELPQLFNVLRGEMSLVGPRPFVVYEDERIDGWARRRLDLTPGITGLWQVLGRNDIGFDEMVKLDYLYVNSWSLWWDVKLLLRTIPVVFKRNGY
jgi:exopolysaccharide biosynthesis polyprenyl glycosylphosphotransferase